MAILYSVDVKMTAILEKLISIIAPNSCVGCSAENNTLCESCQQDIFAPLAPVCVFCQKPTVDWRVCTVCSKTVGLKSVWVAADYGSTVAELIKKYKFDRLKSAYKPLARALDTLLPYLEEDVLIVPLPTVPARVRQRGYDQSVLLAKELARIRRLEFGQALRRHTGSRQVGVGRRQRQAQARLAYLPTTILVKGRRIWLVDDICTTGASLNAAARVLLDMGAESVNAVVVARQSFDNS